MSKIKKLICNKNIRSVNWIRYLDEENALLLSPDYQRGDVWGTKRRANLIFSLFSEIPVGSIVLNLRTKKNGEDLWSVVDGKQRIRTVLMFTNNEFSIPGSWFDQDGEIFYKDLRVPDQRSFRTGAFCQVYECFEPEEKEKTIFDLINYGGLQQGETD